jgi:hypothetical protein
MDDRIQNLLNIIGDEISLYRDLIEHARYKTAVLVRGSVEAILECKEIEEKFNLKLRSLETEMSGICRDLSQSFRIPQEEFTLGILAEKLEQSLALEIKTQTTLFRNMVKQLKAVSQRNRRLIEKSIHYSRGVLAFECNASDPCQKIRFFEQISAAHPTFSQRA